MSNDPAVILDFHDSEGGGVFLQRWPDGTLELRCFGADDRLGVDVSREDARRLRDALTAWLGDAPDIEVTYVRAFVDRWIRRVGTPGFFFNGSRMIAALQAELAALPKRTRK